MLEILGSIVTGVLGGGATSLLGLALKAWADASKRKADLAAMKMQLDSSENLRRLDIEAQQKMAELSAASAERLAQIEAETRALVADSDDYRASMANDRATYLAPATMDWAKAQGRWARLVTGLVVLAMGAVDFLRGIIRPGATLYTLALQTALLLWVRELYQQHQVVLTQGQQAEMVLLIVKTATYITTVTVVWWFGARAQARR